METPLVPAVNQITAVILATASVVPATPAANEVNQTKKSEDGFAIWNMAHKRQQEMNKITSQEKVYRTDQGPIWIAEITTPCPKCGSRGVWTYIRDPHLWRCAHCHPLPKAGDPIVLIPEEHLCPSCRHLFCVLSEGRTQVDECTNYARQDISNAELIKRTRIS